MPKTAIEKLEREGRIWWGKDGDSTFPMVKKFLSEMENGVVPQTWWDYKTSGSNRRSNRELREIFDGKLVFENPKPLDLLLKILDIAMDKEGIVLDSFAGSGTTAHAVLAANQKDQGNRKFILIEMEEYADSITAERVRRVIKGVPGARDEVLKNGLGGTFSYFELGQPIDVQGLISGAHLPPYMELARYVFYTATGEAFDPSKVDESRFYIGSSSRYDVYLVYKPDLAFLKSAAINLEFAEGLGPYRDKKRLVFAPMKYLDEYYLEKYHIEYAQLPYEIYRFKG
jgi:adenine-specific DNA-methyltransferase